MGRPSTHDENRRHPGRFRLALLPMIDGGYDKGGAYWGGGSCQHGFMYRAYCHEEDFLVDWFLRARTREEAKQHVRSTYPNAKFFR